MLAGGKPTITITRLGALCGIVSNPVTNRPEVSIVGVNRFVVDIHDAVESIQSVCWLIENTSVLLVPSGCGCTATVRDAKKRSLGWMMKATSASS